MNTSLERHERDYPHKAAKDLECPQCRETLEFFTVALSGVAWQRCRCGECPIPVKRTPETVRHDQTERRDAELGRWLEGAQRPVDTSQVYVRGPSMKLGRGRPFGAKDSVPRGPRHPWRNRSV